MKKRTLIMMLVALCPLLAPGRAVRLLDMPTLIKKSTLVFVGRVANVEQSGILTTMSYPTWKGVTFEWLYCDVEVVEPVKGVKRGDQVRTVMLSEHLAVTLPPYVPGDIMQVLLPPPPKVERRITFNAPGMVHPKEGQTYLLCLAPTTLSNTFAAMTAPWDDNQAIFVLDRDFWLYGDYRKNGKDRFPQLNERCGVLWSLVDDSGELLPAGAEKMRQAYMKDIAAAPPTNLLIHLQWQTHKSASGWQWDVPKGHGTVTKSTGTETTPGGPVTMSDQEGQ